MASGLRTLCCDPLDVQFGQGPTELRACRDLAQLLESLGTPRGYEQAVYIGPPGP